MGIYTHDVHHRWGSVFWRSWARVIRRPPARHWAAERRPNADILHHARPPPAHARTRAHGREAVGGAEAWLQVQPGEPASCAGHARRQACERRAAAVGWREAGTG